MEKNLFEKCLIHDIKTIQKNFAETYKNDSNEGLSIYIDKSGYITAFSMDEKGNRIFSYVKEVE